MKKRKIIKILAALIIIGILIAGGTFIYMFNMPHRDVQSSTADFTVTSTEIVNEYLLDTDAANQKYLAADGESKILQIKGVVSNISEDFNGQKVILLKSENDKAGVNATLTSESNILVSDVKIGETISIKGVIRAGAAYDEDLEMYENVILEKANIVSKK
jgi:tRNA_anti-like